MRLQEDEIKKGVESYLKTNSYTDSEIEISDIRYINIGNENDVYSVVAKMSDNGTIQCMNYIVRVYVGLLPKERARNEYSNLKKLKAAGYPVPELYGLDLEGTFLGRPFAIMERIMGQNLSEVFNHTDQETYDRLTNKWICLLSELHKLEVNDFIDSTIFIKDQFLYQTQYDQEHLFSAIDNFINFLKYFLATYQGGNEFDMSIRWLEENKYLAQCSKPSVIHQDFNDNNILVDEQEKLYVIDWSALDISDYRMDLASVTQVWTKFKDMKFRDRIINIYENFAGEKVDNMEYFEAAICLRKLILAAISVNNDINKHGIRKDEEMKQELLQYKSTYSYWLKVTGVQISFMENI